MNAVTPLQRQALEALLGRYEVGELVHYWPVAHGIENTNYFLRTRRRGAQQEWVLTILEQASNAGEVFAPLLGLCFQAGLPVAPIVRNASGDVHETLGGKLVLLTPRLPGEHPLRPTLGQIRALGKAIAKLHLATARPGFNVPPHPRNATWLRRCADAVHPHLNGAEARLLDALLRRVNGLLRRLEAAPLPLGVIHGDLFRDNVLFAGDVLTGLLDFHHAAAGYLIYDLAVVVNDWCSKADGRLDEDQANALLAAYQSVRPLSAAELDAFGGFLSYAALAFWLSRLSAAIKARRGPPARLKNADEFRRISADRLVRLDS